MHLTNRFLECIVGAFSFLFVVLADYGHRLRFAVNAALLMEFAAPFRTGR